MTKKNGGAEVARLFTSNLVHHPRMETPLRIEGMKPIIGLNGENIARTNDRPGKEMRQFG